MFICVFVCKEILQIKSNQIYFVTQTSKCQSVNLTIINKTNVPTGHKGSKTALIYYVHKKVKIQITTADENITTN